MIEFLPNDEKELRVRDRTAEAVLSGNRIEVMAEATRCIRHLSHTRGCAWKNDLACACRNAALMEWDA